MYRLALGEIGMSESELMDTTPRAFTAKVKGWSEAIKRMERMEWERARWAAATSVSPHLKKAIKPTDLFRFEDEKKAQKLDPEIDAEAIRIAKKFKPQ